MNGFTLIEILVSVALLSIGLVWILEGYGSILNATRKARFLTEGTLLLQERMADEELKIRVGEIGGGTNGGVEGGWEWSTGVGEVEKGKWYELKGEVRRSGSMDGEAIEGMTYVRP